MRRTTARAFITSLVILGAGALTSWLPLPDDGTAHAGEGCTDPTPGAGGKLEFTFYGFLSENHFASAEGDVCPDATEVWTFTNFGPPFAFDQYIGTRVLPEKGLVSIHVLVPNGDQLSLEAAEEYRAIHRRAEGLVTYTVNVTGNGISLARYRVEACRGAVQISGPCIFEPRGLLPTAVVSPSGTAPPKSSPPPTPVPALPPTGGGGGSNGRFLQIAGASAVGMAGIVALAGAAWLRRRA